MNFLLTELTGVGVGVTGAASDRIYVNQIYKVINNTWYL